MLPECKMCQVMRRNDADQLQPWITWVGKQYAKKVESGSRGVLCHLLMNLDLILETMGNLVEDAMVLFRFEIIHLGDYEGCVKEAVRSLLMNWEERGLRTAKTYLGSDICKNREESRIQGWGLTRSWSKNEGSKAGVMRKGTSVLVCWALGTYRISRQRCQQKAGRMHQKHRGGFWAEESN